MAATPIKKRWQKRGFTYHEQTDPAGKRWARHWHRVDEIVRGSQGSIVVEVADQKRRLIANQELVIPARALHHIENPTKHRSSYFYGFRKKKRD